MTAHVNFELPHGAMWQKRWNPLAICLSRKRRHNVDWGLQYYVTLKNIMGKFSDVTLNGDAK